MKLTVERLWRIAALLILATFLQTSQGSAWLFTSRRRRRRNPLPPQMPVKCSQPEWSQWSECKTFCPYTLSKTNRQSRYRETVKSNKCVKDTSYQNCPINGGCKQVCNELKKKCDCLSGYLLDSDGKKCIDKDECNSNGGRGPCSHSCQNTAGDYSCLCEKGYRLDGRTRCVKLNCGPPKLSPCPAKTPKQRKSINKQEFNNNLHLCETIKYVCGNGTKYNAMCTLSCPHHYRIALKTYNQPWSVYGAFDFNTPSNRIMCHVLHGTTVTWHTQLDRYVCRRINDPPHSIALSNMLIKESQPSGTVVGQLTARDAQRNHIVYSVNSLDGRPLFRCRDKYLESLVMFKWKPRGQNSYPVLIRAQDNGAPRMWTQHVFNITVTNVDDPPRSIEISANSVYENASNGDVIGTLTAIDDDVSQERSSRFAWTLLGNPTNFKLAGADVVVSGLLNYDSSKVHYIKVRCNDSVMYSETDLLIYVINSIDPPTLSLSGDTVRENAKLGTVVGEIEAKSEGDGDITFTLGAFDAHVQNKFALSPTPFCRRHRNATKFNTTCYVNLTVSGELDYEDTTEYVVQVFVKNRESSNYRKWNISIEDVNERPEKLEFNGETEIPETIKSDENFCFLMVSDPDNKRTMKQSHKCHVINQGGDGQYFRVNPITNALQVKVNKTLNYERQQAYHVSITCTDDGKPPLSITQDVIINVTDTDEPIENMSLSNNQIFENATVGMLVGVLNAYDPDIHRPNTMMFSIMDPKDGPFRLQGDHNKLIVLDKPVNFEEDPAFVVNIRVNDTGGSHLQWPFQINVLDVNERPTDIRLSTLTMNENLLQGSFISNITMVDEDENTMASCELLEDGEGRIAVNDTMLMAGARAANYETDSSTILGISLKCCDQFSLCLTKNFSIQVEDVNEPPTDITISSLEIPENQKHIIIGNISIVDPDKNQKHFCTVSNEKEKEYLDITMSAGVKMLHLIKELDFEQGSVQRFQINCTEVGTNSPYSLTKQFDLNVLDINEAPTPGCSYPLYVSPEQSLGTILGYLNVTDPDNENTAKDQEPCQQKQQLRYTIHSKHKDLTPFKLADGYLVKTGENQDQVNKVWNLLISVEDDGVIYSMPSGQTVQNKMTITFNCTVISTTFVSPLITLSENQVDERSRNGTIIGYLNTTILTHTNNTYNNYELVKEKCSSYPFVIIHNELMLKFHEARGSRQKNEAELPNYVIIQVKNDVISTRFMILIKNEKTFHSWICFSNNTMLTTEALDTKLGPIRILNAASNNTEKMCLSNDNDVLDQGDYMCEVTPSFNSSSRDFQKVNLTNRIYVDREMFLRFNTSLDDADMTLKKLVVHVTCWDPGMPLHIVKDDLTVFLKDCQKTIIEGEKKVCVSCRHKHECKQNEVCIDSKQGYKCTPTENTCEARKQKRENTFCENSTCSENSSKVCSNTTQRCIDRSNQLFIGLSFLLRENSYCTFEKCLEGILDKKEKNCVQNLTKESSDQSREKRDTKKSFSVEIFNVKTSQTKSIVSLVVWKIENGGIQLAEKSSVLSLLQNTKGFVLINTKKDCAGFEDIECPMIQHENASKKHLLGLLQKPKFQAVLGSGAAIVLIVIVIVVVYFWKKRRDKKRQMAKRPSTCPVLGDIDNFAFDGNEMTNAEHEIPKEVEREKGNQNKNKKQKKPKHNFNNPVYEEPRQLETIRNNQDEKKYETIRETGEYAEPVETKVEKKTQGAKSVFNAYYAATDGIVVQRTNGNSEENPNSSSQQGQSCNSTDKNKISRTTVNNSRCSVMKTETAINKNPYYEELPPVQKIKNIKRGPTSNEGYQQDSTEIDEDAGSSSPYYHILDPPLKTDGQGDITNKEKESPLYFELEQSAPTEKQYQSLHRELDPPLPEYESYRVPPEKSGVKNQDGQATQARVYEEPFHGNLKPNS